PHQSAGRPSHRRRRNDDHARRCGGRERRLRRHRRENSASAAHARARESGTRCATVVNPFFYLTGVYRPPLSRRTPSPAAMRLNAGTSVSTALRYSPFAAFSSLLNPSRTPIDASVGRLSAPPATSPAPLLTTPFSQIRF